MAILWTSTHMFNDSNEAETIAVGDCHRDLIATLLVVGSVFTVVQLEIDLPTCFSHHSQLVHIVRAAAQSADSPEDYTIVQLIV